MRKVGAYLAATLVAATAFYPLPTAAFGLRIGPFHIGVPIYLPHFPRFHRHRLYMHANRAEVSRSERHGEPAAAITSALLYPNLALSGLSRMCSSRARRQPGRSAMSGFSPPRLPGCLRAKTAGCVSRRSMPTPLWRAFAVKSRPRPIRSRRCKSLAARSAPRPDSWPKRAPARSPPSPSPGCNSWTRRSRN